jgi:salicylate hydroxylase/6-hydroxynicotinate 3-monooxygenase
MGGLAAAATLRRIGMDVHVFEQATQFARVGAGIQVSPNAFRVLRGLGLEPHIRSFAFEPPSWRSRVWDTGEEKFDYPLGPAAEARYGAPYLQLHRGDLHAALASVVPNEVISLNRRLTGVDQNAQGVTLHFADGSRTQADAVIGADGTHSRVRELLLGQERPQATGRVAYRTVFPASLLNGYEIDEHTKWWGEDRHIVIYFVNNRKDEVYFVTSVPEPDWALESWSAQGDLSVLRKAYAGFHEQVQRVLAACPSVHKWAIVERQPLHHWTESRVTLLGDACHPMVPYMAQGAAMAMEDAVVLARCLEGSDADGLPAALKRYEQVRKDRTSRVQLTSHLNKWMGGNTNADWVYSYDAWQVPLEPPEPVPAVH